MISLNLAHWALTDSSGNAHVRHDENGVAVCVAPLPDAECAWRTVSVSSSGDRSWKLGDSMSLKWTTSDRAQLEAGERVVDLQLHRPWFQVIEPVPDGTTGKWTVDAGLVRFDRQVVQGVWVRAAEDCQPDRVVKAFLPITRYPEFEASGLFTLRKGEWVVASDFQKCVSETDLSGAIYRKVGAP